MAAAAHIEALGYLSAELAGRADAWHGNAPEWFPDPPEWLELWEQALEATGAHALEDALEAGERSHLLTVGSPVRGLALRVTLGSLDRHGRWHPRRPGAFLVWRGRRV